MTEPVRNCNQKREDGGWCGSKMFITVKEDRPIKKMFECEHGHTEPLYDREAEGQP